MNLEPAPRTGTVKHTSQVGSNLNCGSAVQRYGTYHMSFQYIGLLSSCTTAQDPPVLPLNEEDIIIPNIL